MSYRYIREHYGLDFKFGDRVMHDETQKHGAVVDENSGCAHYVQVQFDGARFPVPCHPQSLIKEGQTPPTFKTTEAMG